ncbi:nitroreductase [Guyparkeria hydrothermalis]|uniref:nitroreductase family protein n=1 Tax=Guyparkeria hydrothermalis TaxID=923 RepID=UPI0020220012|nr:nitroreductase [Guyparkeria hydrothermalis]MCL7744299.1 nitroreductase [Guyparkeria hydrothermalis]
MNQAPELLDALIDRHSTPATCLVEPAPDDDTLQRILQAAESAPDHGGLHPWRFLVIDGEALERLGELFVEAMRTKDPEASEATLERERVRAHRAPMIVAAIAREESGHAKIPEVEQLLAAGSAASQLLLAARAAGFGAIWLTGMRVYDPNVMRGLGLAENERLIGLINIGTIKDGAPTRGKRRRRAEIERWTG